MNCEKSKQDPTIYSQNENVMHIAVLMGGLSVEREVSMISGRAVVENLVEMGYTVTAIDMGRDISQILSQLKPNLVFNALHGTYGEDGCVAGLLEIMGIPYTHSGVFASAIALDKVHSQNLFIMNGILCPKRVLIKKGQDYAADPLPRPYIIKPVSQGSSFGLMAVFEGDVHDASTYDFKYGDVAIVEEFIEGKEINVAIMGQQAIGTLEIVMLKSKIFDFESKYTQGLTKHVCPAPLSDENTKKILEISSKIAHIINCRGISRAEFRFNEKENKFYFLEINTHPGFTPISIVPEIAAFNNIDFKEVLKFLIEDAFNYYAKKKQTN